MAGASHMQRADARADLVIHVMENQLCHQGIDSLFTIQKEQINCFTAYYYWPVYQGINCEWLTGISAVKHGLLHCLVSQVEKNLVSSGQGRGFGICL